MVLEDNILLGHTLKSILNRLIDRRIKQDKTTVLQGIVKNIDLTRNTCTVTVLEMDYPNCQFQALTSMTVGILLVPSLNSTVIINFTDNGKIFIEQTSVIDKFLCKINNTIFQIADGLTQFNDGSNGGLTNTPELKTQLNKLTSRVDGIISAINNAKPAPGDMSGAGVLSTMQIGLQLILNKEDFSNIEDTKIKH